MSGAPLSATSSVLATWVGGDLAWNAGSSAGASGSGVSMVISIDELHVGDGQVLAPAEVLVVDGRIAEVGRTVSHPSGCTVVRGVAVMPGMIDARVLSSMKSTAFLINTARGALIDEHALAIALRPEVANEFTFCVLVNESKRVLRFAFAVHILALLTRSLTPVWRGVVHAGQPLCRGETRAHGVEVPVSWTSGRPN